MKILSLFIIVFLAYLFVHWINKRPYKLKLLLTFSGAFLLSTVIIHIFEEVYSSDLPYLGGFVLLGVLIQVMLEFLSKGVEHGHIHKSHKNIWVLFISLSIHSFIEGMPIIYSNQMYLGVLIHKLPISIVVITFLTNISLSKVKVFLMMFLFAIMTPIGGWVGNFWNDEYKLYILSISGGIILHVSSVILFESQENHKLNNWKLIAILLGFILPLIIY